MKILLAAAAASLVAVGAHASSVTYDLKAAANSGGGIGESIYSSFDTNSFFAGPNVRITASATDDDDPDQFVYFDNGNAGIGVCKDWNGDGAINVASNNGGNKCRPSSDDGLTTTSESLHFKATATAMVIESIWLNSNHDGGGILGTVWEIGGVVYDFTSMVADSVSGTGDVRIDLGIKLNMGDVLSLKGVSGPNSYISALAVSAVPLPAPALMLIAGIGALGAAARRRRKSA